MSLMTLQLYQNNYYYPHFSQTLTSYGEPYLDCTPVGMNLRSGTIRVKGDMSDFMSCNYLSLERDNQTIYGWIDDVVFHTANSFQITYTVDAWRTYQNNVTLGTQYLDRIPDETNKRDPLLGSDQAHQEVESQMIEFLNNDRRVMVVQVRPEVDEFVSPAPVQPSNYKLYFCEYNIFDMSTQVPIRELLTALRMSGESSNIVTLYSIPYADTSVMVDENITVRVGNDNEQVVTGWKLLDMNNPPSNVADVFSQNIPLHIYYGDLSVTPEELLRRDHSVQVVIPSAGILEISDDLLMKDNLYIRQDVDVLSGGCNYMLMSEDSNGNEQYYTQSVRGSDVSSIPILSNPEDTYVSQNQNALNTSMMGDVATVAGSVAMMTPMGRAIGAGLGMGGGMTTGAGLLGAYSGVNSIVDRKASIQDAGQRYNNPPATLGTALAGQFNNRVWLVARYEPVDNTSDVHGEYGYQYGKVTQLTFPTSGFIKTEGCNVRSDGTVPRWALDEINRNFDNGILVH